MIDFWSIPVDFRPILSNWSIYDYSVNLKLYNCFWAEKLFLSREIDFEKIYLFVRCLAHPKNVPFKKVGEQRDKVGQNGTKRDVFRIPIKKNNQSTVWNKLSDPISILQYFKDFLANFGKLWRTLANTFLANSKI